MNLFYTWLILISMLRDYRTSVLSTDESRKVNTDLANEPDDRPLLLATLGGGMVAVNQISGEIIWTFKDEPAVKVPNSNDNPVPQFLPDPRHGNLYMFAVHGDQRQVLKKLPFTIPQLVANAPCKSSDGILYTGKKVDTWFMIDPKTGIRKQVLGYGKTNPFDATKDNTCPIDTKNAVYVARTEYNILMYDSKNSNQKWNVTYFDYSSHTMEQEMTNKYGIVHFTSTSNGKVTSFDRQTGDMVWSHDLQSPVIAAYLLDREGLISVPFNTVGDDTMEHILDDFMTPGEGKGFKDSNVELFPSLYVGEHIHGLYALTSLVDKHTITISADETLPLLLEGPKLGNDPNPYGSNKHRHRQNMNVNFNVDEKGNTKLARRYLLLGHYNIPEYAETDLRFLSKYNQIIFSSRVRGSISHEELKLIAGPSDDLKEIKWLDRKNDSFVKINLSKNIDGSNAMQSIGIQTDFQDSVINETVTTKYSIKYILSWISQQDNIEMKFAMLILIGIVFFMFIYLRNQIREFQQLSQSGSKNSNQSSGTNLQITALSEEMGNGMIRVGKIVFNPEQILGKGCEGTFVYKGAFENRDVAVKRLLPECFTFADREVALLSESDAHPNVVRYFCMEQDKLFRYIALELCAATLQEYVQKKLGEEYKINALEVLHQATAGLVHLHGLNIVHRDIKPHNVLLSIPSNTGEVRAMISDFGLCKKLNLGRHSFSRRSGVTGTDGWIAPEMINGERTTTSVDVFSLGCVFYYVLSNGAHPFGNVLERQAKILTGHFDLKHIESTRPEEEVHLTLCLLKAMLSPKPMERPKVDVVYNYPIFWDKLKILAFFQDVSDRVEKDPPGGPLEKGGIAVVRGDWRGWVGEDVAADLRKYRSYGGNSVKDLLRAMRNKKHHYRELTEEAQKSLGSIPNGFTLYWLTRFPRLLLHTWLQMQIYKQEEVFKAYYNEAYTFNSNFIMQEIEEHELSKYEKEEFLEETNKLFVKSKNYYESPKLLKFKNYETKIIGNNSVEIENWRTGARPDVVDFRQSPVKNNRNRDNNRYRDDIKRERRRPNRNNINTYANDLDSHIMNSAGDQGNTQGFNKVENKTKITADVLDNYRVRQRKAKKPEEPVLWVTSDIDNADNDLT